MVGAPSPEAIAWSMLIYRYGVLLLMLVGGGYIAWKLGRIAAILEGFG